MSEEIVLYKDYYKEKQIQLIKSIIPEDKFGTFTPLIYDILLRRAYTFEQSDEDIIRDAKKVMENISKIEFARKDQFSDDIYILGHYNLRNGILQLNVDSYERYYDRDRLYKTLTHEVYHAIATDRSDPEHLHTGLQFYNKKGLCGRIYNEIFNESAAYLAAANPSDIQKKSGYHLGTSYDKVLFFAPLLVTIFGLSEKELYKEGITNRDRFYEFLSSKLPEDKRHDLIKSLVDIEIQLRTIFSIYSKEPDEKLPTDNDDIEKCMETITKHTYQMFQTIIRSNPIINKVVYKDYIHRFIKAICIIENQKRFLGIERVNDNNLKSYKVDGFAQTRSLLLLIKYVSSFDSSYTNEEKKQILEKILSSEKEKPIEKTKDALPFIKTIAAGRKIPLKFTKKIGIDHRLIKFYYIRRDFDSGKIYDNLGVHQMIDKAYSEYTAQRPTPIKPKDIAEIDQESNVAEEEINHAEAVFKQILEVEKSGKGENPEHD